MDKLTIQLLSDGIAGKINNQLLALTPTALMGAEGKKRNVIGLSAFAHVGMYVCEVAFDLRVDKNLECTDGKYTESIDTLTLIITNISVEMLFERIEFSSQTLADYVNEQIIDELNGIEITKDVKYNVLIKKEELYKYQTI
jgi:hypothetical protein